MLKKFKDLLKEELEKNRDKNPVEGYRSLEKLYHFQCGDCSKWWTVGDAPENKLVWYCPWCGRKQKCDNE